MRVLLANPRGFCAGVDRAIAIVERAIQIHGAPIYVRHEVVHNRYVVSQLREKGAVFVEQLAEVPDGAIVIFSAHGVSLAVRREAERRHLRVFDATCPLVTKVHMEVSRNLKEGYECILIGHAGHPEVEGTLGQYTRAEDAPPIHLVEDVAAAKKLEVSREKLAYVTQTTLSMDDTQEVVQVLKSRFPNIRGPRKDDICYATQNRQDAVKDLANQCDVVLVVGSKNSSNSNRLQEVSVRLGTPAYLIDEAAQIDRNWFREDSRIGVSAGASAPEILVTQVIERLKGWGAELVRESQGVREDVVFVLPKELRG